MPRNTFRVRLLTEGATRLTCREANCQQMEHGWMTILDETTRQGQAAAHYIRREAGRRFIAFASEEATNHLGAAGLSIAPGLTVFKFWPGQTCFRQHLDREVVFSQQKGEARRLFQPRDFNEAFNESAQRAVETARKG